MYRMQNDTLSMSVTDPDLEFYSGPDDSPVDENAEERSSVFIPGSGTRHHHSHPYRFLFERKMGTD